MSNHGIPSGKKAKRENDGGVCWCNGWLACLLRYGSIYNKTPNDSSRWEEIKKMAG